MTLIIRPPSAALPCPALPCPALPWCNTPMSFRLLGLPSARFVRHLSSHSPISVPLLGDASLESFRQRCWHPERPSILPSSSFSALPALTRWFRPPQLGRTAFELDVDYLREYAETIVPLELSGSVAKSPSTPSGTTGAFQRVDAPLGVFLDWIQRKASLSSERLYLAQASILELPRSLRHDLPAPHLVMHAGRGDVYDANIWIGLAPTYTPLHRDPNPNLLVQLAGTKVVRLYRPAAGGEVFARVQEQVGSSSSAVFRGDEMMQGEENRLLEEAVWQMDPATKPSQQDVYEAQLERGDGLFIPKRWWHSIKGVGEGVTASVRILSSPGV